MACTVNSPLSAPTRNASHSANVKETAPASGRFELRTNIDAPSLATSTQLPDPLALAFLHKSAPCGRSVIIPLSSQLLAEPLLPRPGAARAGGRTATGPVASDRIPVWVSGGREQRGCREMVHEMSRGQRGRYPDSIPT